MEDNSPDGPEAPQPVAQVMLMPRQGRSTQREPLYPKKLGG